jgi:hypothetical protein
MQNHVAIASEAQPHNVAASRLAAKATASARVSVEAISQHICAGVGGGSCAPLIAVIGPPASGRRSHTAGSHEKSRIAHLHATGSASMDLGAINNRDALHGLHINEK